MRRVHPEPRTDNRLPSAEREHSQSGLPPSDGWRCATVTTRGNARFRCPHERCAPSTAASSRALSVNRAHAKTFYPCRNHAFLRFERSPLQCALETDLLAEAGGFQPLHFGSRSAAVDHGLRLSLGMMCGTTTSIEMRTFECSRRESSRILILRCRASNPPASSGQSVSNAYGIGSRSKCREMAAFRT
jgi:hypothetical protein